MRLEVVPGGQPRGRAGGHRRQLRVCFRAMIPSRTLQAILEEVERLGATGGEPSSLGELLAEAVVDTSEQHADTADLLELIDRLGDSHNPYVRQVLAGSI